VEATVNPTPAGTPLLSNEPSMCERLRAVLEPRAGERLLEVGCGAGYYALHVARDLMPNGSLEIVDANPEFLDEAIRRAREHRLVNVGAVLGDPRYLPYDTDAFDAAYLVAALGDAQDHDTALHELARVVRPRGRIVVGELHGDPHRIGVSALRASCPRAGLTLTHSVDGGCGYFAVLEPARTTIRAAPDQG
jgi:ubiquinone/menaquinone biosynthesis C-methylase UbiE